MVHLEPRKSYTTLNKMDINDNDFSSNSINAM